MNQTTGRPDVTILIPVYNTARFLPRALDSVLAQTWKNLEVVAVNDASPDNAAEVLADYAARDPRVRIVWEDCGAFPYAYMPENLTGRAETAAFTDELAHLRPNASVGVVFKGMICLDWTTFVHRTAPERIGEASETAIAQRQPTARRIMRLVQSSWLTNGGAMLDTVRQLAVHEDSQILALLEDGLFDRQIWFPAALFAAALWDCGQSIDQLIHETALRPDVVFA